MKYARLYTGADGETHYEDLEMKIRAITGRSSHGSPWAATEAIFLSSPEDSNSALDTWHPLQRTSSLSCSREPPKSRPAMARFGDLNRARS